VVPNQVKWALPIWVQIRSCLCDAVSVIHAAFVKPARNTARASSKKFRLPAIKRRNRSVLGNENAEPSQQRDQPSIVTCPDDIGEHEAAQLGSK